MMQTDYSRKNFARYDRARISPEKGERWFCTDAEARDAGWRAAR